MKSKKLLTASVPRVGMEDDADFILWPVTGHTKEPVTGNRL